MNSTLAHMLATLHRPRMLRRMIALVLGITVMGLGVAVFDRIGFGTDPCSTMNLGISRAIGISFGTMQMLMNASMLFIVIRRDPEKIGPGTIANMVFVGYIAEFFMHVLDHIPAMVQPTLPLRLLLFPPMMALFLFAVSLYIIVDLGIAPYDAMPFILSAHTRRMHFQTVRICWDVTALVIGYLLGATVGLTTLITGFCVGPAVAGLTKRIRRWFES